MDREGATDGVRDGVADGIRDGAKDEHQEEHGTTAAEASDGVRDADPHGTDPSGGDDPGVGDSGRQNGGIPTATNGSGEAADVSELAQQYAYLEDVESELSLAQRWVHGRVTDVLDDLSERLGSEADSRFCAELLSTLVRGPKSAREVASDLNAGLERVETALSRLEERDIVEYDDTGWRIVC
ncbi:hypothetical protein [Halobellus captivus]